MAESFKYNHHGSVPAGIAVDCNLEMLPKLALEVNEGFRISDFRTAPDSETEGSSGVHVEGRGILSDRVRT